MSFWEPYGEELVVGTTLPPAPAITLDEGLAWQYQAIVGDGLRLPLSAPLSQRVTGGRRLVNPALVLQVAIGQSTVATRRVVANLFYRNVQLHKQLELGSSIRTIVTPVAAAASRPGAAGARAKVLLSIETRDQDDEMVLSFERLALIPMADANAFIPVGEVGVADSQVELTRFRDAVPAGWDVSELTGAELQPVGETAVDPLSEPVDNALALVRITQNLAAAHRDVRRGQAGRRLVYGGHTIGLAQASLSRADSSIVTVLGWQSCDHLAPVFEGDLLTFSITRLAGEPAAQGGAIVAYRVDAAVERGGEDVTVLSWVPVVWTAATLPAGEGVGL